MRTAVLRTEALAEDALLRARQSEAELRDQLIRVNANSQMGAASAATETYAARNAAASAEETLAAQQERIDAMALAVAALQKE